MGKAHWTNGKKTVSGNWAWHWASQRFVIDFDVPVSAHGERKRHWVTTNETPEIGRWKLIRDIPSMTNPTIERRLT